MHRARYKLLNDASGRNLGPLTEAEKGDSRKLQEILVQDCGRKMPHGSTKWRAAA